MYFVCHHRCCLCTVSYWLWLYKLFVWKSNVDNDDDDLNRNNMETFHFLSLSTSFSFFSSLSLIINRYKSLSFSLCLHKWSMQCLFLRCLVLDVYYLKCHTIFQLKALAFTSWLLWQWIVYVCMCDRRNRQNCTLFQMKTSSSIRFV